jgi:hypothetical protein
MYKNKYLKYKKKYLALKKQIGNGAFADIKKDLIENKTDKTSKAIEILKNIKKIYIEYVKINKFLNNIPKCLELEKSKEDIYVNYKNEKLLSGDSYDDDIEEKLNTTLEIINRRIENIKKLEQPDLYSRLILIESEYNNYLKQFIELYPSAKYISNDIFKLI